MNSSRTRIRVLLDTTYLLRVVGVGVEGVEELLVVLEKMYKSGEITIYYTPFSILGDTRQAL